MATFATEGHQGRQPQTKSERPHAPISDSREYAFKSRGSRPLSEKPNPYEKEEWYKRQQEELKKAQDKARQIIKEQQAQVDAAKKKKEEEEKKKKGGS